MVTPVIIDFGLARHLTLPDLTQTVLGARIGTPAYFAPEQFDGNKPTSIPYRPVHRWRSSYMKR